MKYKVKKVLSLFFVVMMMITTMFTVKTTVQAATVKDGGYSGYWYYTKQGLLAGGRNILPQRLHFYNGIPAYCVEPTKEIKLGSDVYNTSSLEAYNALSTSIKQKISEISYFGYGYSGRKDPIHYIATQALIWETINSEYKSMDVHYLPHNPAYGHLDNSNKVTDKINAIKEAIKKDVNSYEATLKAPNFQIYDENNKPVGKSGQFAKLDNGIVGKTYTVIDKNNIIQSRKILQNTFSDAKIQGNKITIKLGKNDLNKDNNIEFITNRAMPKVGFRPFILTSTAQNVIVKGDMTDPPSGRVSIKAIGHTAKIQKLTEGQLALPGATLGLYEDLNNNGKYDVGEPKVKEFTTTDQPTEIQGLVPGKNYVLHELKAPKGYVSTEDISLPIKDKDVSVKMVDKSMDVIIKKVTDKGDPVADVTLSILNEDGTVATDKDGNKAIYQTKADQDWHAGKYLEEGKKYILRETEVVAGVYRAKDVEFTAPKKGDKTLSITVTMIDKTMKILVDKVDNHGKPVVGATLQVLDENKQVITEFKTQGKPVDISKYLQEGKKYILHEKKAPFGYELMKDIEFEAKGTQEQPQVIQGVDARKKYFVSVEKVDAQNPNKKLKGAEITLFTKDGKIAKDVHGKDCVALTDEKGMVVFEVEYNEDMGGYYAQETKAPVGYRMNHKHHKVVLSEDYHFAKENPVKIVVNDEALPSIQTADHFNGTLYGGVLLVALGAFGFLVIKRKQLTN